MVEVINVRYVALIYCVSRCTISVHKTAGTRRKRIRTYSKTCIRGITLILIVVFRTCTLVALLFFSLLCKEFYETELDMRGNTDSTSYETWDREIFLIILFLDHSENLSQIKSKLSFHIKNEPLFVCVFSLVFCFLLHF